MADNINTSSATTTTMSSSTGAPTSVAAGGAGGGSKFNNNNHNKNHNNTSSDVLKSGSNKHGNVIHRTTSESLRLGGDNNMNVNSGSSAKNAKTSKTSSFQITSVTVGTSRASGGDNGDDSADDLDTDDNSRITDLENETPSFSEDTFSKEDVFFSNNPIGTAPVIPTSSQYGLAIVTPPDDGHMLNHNHNLLNDIGVTDGGSIVNLNANLAAGKNASEVDLKELSHRNERFKVVKIESTEPFKRGRWVCMDYLDHTTLQQSKQEGDGVDSAPQTHASQPDIHPNNVAVTRDSGVVVTENNIDIESMPNSATHIQNDMSTSSPGSSANNQPQQHHHQNNHQNMEVGSLDSGILNNGTLSSGSSGEHVSKQNHHAQSMINIPLSSTPSNVSSNVPMHHQQQQHHHPQTLSQFNLQKVITTQQNDMPQTPPPQQQQQQLHPSTTGTPLLTSPAGAVLTNHAQGATLPSNLVHNIGTTPTNALQQHQIQSQQNPNNPNHNHHHQNHQAMSMGNISLHENSLQSHQSSGAIAAGAAAANQNQNEQQQQSQLNSNTPNNINNNINNNISHTPDGGTPQQYIQPPTSLSSQTSMSISSPSNQQTSLPATMTSGIGTPNNNNNNNNTVLNQEGQVVSANPTNTTTQSQPNTILNNNLVNEINEIAASTIFKTIDDGQLQQQISTTLPGGVSAAAATEESTQPTEDGESLSELALALSSTNTQSNYGNDVKGVNNNSKMQGDGGDASQQSSQDQQSPHQHHHHHHHHHHRHGGPHHSKTPEPITTTADSNKTIFTSIALGNCIKNLMNTAANPKNINVDTIIKGSDFPNKSIQNFIKAEIHNIPIRNKSKIAGGSEQTSSSKMLMNVGGTYPAAAQTSIGGAGKVVVVGGSGSASRSTSPQPVSSAAGGNCSSSGGNCETASASGTSAVAIDNKIEQAMDLVKSHLMFAVREEVEVLKEKIAELMDRINQLEIENTILKANATQETLSQLSVTVASSKVPPANPANGPVS